ncbi:cell cycle checkpoint [Cystobasidium minutum MCA 4210]|uniref:cell cycle checkpoint n=1 Tax=Cystobasidium minutum MCA 4210 TaxID=1397322 RepID=UPI0034CF546B|eukprot:jgi/Rhomi1/114512/CE114511_442
MRFKAEVSNANALIRLVSSVEGLSQRGILKLTREKIYLICAGEGAAKGPQVWAQINVPSVFSDFKIESNVENQIFLEFVPAALSKALKSASGATEIIVRLAKRVSDNHPILSFNISSASRGGHSVDIVQEVAVRVLKLAELEEMAKEPMCPEPDVHIMLPASSESLRGVVDRMKNIGNVITVSANLQGVLKLRVESDLAKVETEWRDLKHPEIELTPSQANEQVDPSELHSVDIDAKHLLKLLHALANGNHTIACICSRVCLIAYVYIGDNRESQADNAGILTWFIAGRNEGD